MDASSKLLAAGWSPESLRRALLDDDEEDQNKGKNNACNRAAIPSTTLGNCAVEVDHNKENVRQQQPKAITKGVVIDLTETTPCKPNTSSKSVPTCSDEIDGLVWKFKQQSLGSSSNTTTQKPQLVAAPTTAIAAAAAAAPTIVIAAAAAAARSSSEQSKCTPPPAAIHSTATTTTTTTANSNSSQLDALISAAKLDDTLPNGWTLFPHQKEAVIGCLKLGRTIMAFDMGLGKTLISLIWAKAVSSVVTGGCTTVVIVPCTLIEVWRREAMMLGFDVYGQGSLASKHSISIHSWAKIPEPADVGRKYLLIADEAHAMQSFTSQRTKAALRLCAGGSYLLSILNH